MKRSMSLSLAVVAIMFFLHSQSAISAHFVIEEPDSYEYFEVSEAWFGWPTPIVDMTGGHIGDPEDGTSGMYTYDGGTLNVSGGIIDYLHTYNSSTVNVSGGLVSHWDCFDELTITSYDSSTINLYDGAFLFGGSFHLFMLYDSSTLNVYGGDVALFVLPKNYSSVNIHGGRCSYPIFPYDYSTINVYGGYIDTFIGNVSIPETATVNIYGYGFDYDPNAEWHYWEDPCEGWWISRLTAYDCNGGPITYWGLPDPSTHPNINLVPDFVPPSGLDLGDYAVLACAWQSSPGYDNWNQICDVSDPNDDIIDWRDLSVLRKYWLAGR
ncbi:MAG: hypothetical protein ACYS4W_15430 [Planctomycetota bacterium]|jgi:hypothetical protein